MNQPPKCLVGVVVSAGRMHRAVKVRTAKQVYHSFLRKVRKFHPRMTAETRSNINPQHFQSHENFLVSDPNSSLRLGDVVRIEDEGRQISRRIRHVVTEIIAPWGTRVEERPPVLNKEERHNIWKEKYDTKKARRAAGDKVQGAATGAKVAANVREGSRGTRDAKTLANKIPQTPPTD